jgi:hypothetical protein
MAGELEKANDEAIAFVESSTDGHWATMVAGEDWTVGVVLHHIAVGHLQMIDWLGRACRHEEITKTASEIDDDNARHARTFADVSRADTVEELRRHGAALATLLRGLSGDDLAIAVGFGPGDGVVVTVGQLAAVGARHCRTHLSDARRALEPGTI